MSPELANEMMNMVLIFFGLQALIYIIAYISMTMLRSEKNKLKMVATASYTALKRLREKDKIFYNSVIMELPDLEKKIVTELLKPIEENSDEK